MKITKLEEETTYREIERIFTLSVKNMIIKVKKWQKEDNLGYYDNDHEILDKKNFNKLTENEQIEFEDYLDL